VSAGPVNLIVELHVKEGEAAAFAAMFRREFVARSRAEQGCAFYDLWASHDDPHRMAIVERWACRADLDRHLAQPWFADWAPKMEAALRAPLVVRFLGDT
jgi:quinol monooxygenase YgiN